MKITRNLPMQGDPQLGSRTKSRHKTQRVVKTAQEAIKPNPSNIPTPANPADVAWQRMIAVLDAGLVKLFSEEERLQFTYLHESATDKPPPMQASHNASVPINLLEEQQVALAVVARPWTGAVVKHVVINAGVDESTMLKQKNRPKTRPKKHSKKSCQK